MGRDYSDNVENVVNIIDYMYTDIETRLRMSRLDREYSDNIENSRLFFFLEI